MNFAMLVLKRDDEVDASRDGKLVYPTIVTLFAVVSLRDVPPVGGGEVDDDSPGLHDVEHLLGDEHGHLATGDEGRGDNDVDVGSLLEHQTRRQVGGGDVISGGLTWIIVSDFPCFL